MSEIKTNKVSPVGANGTVTLGDSGDTISYGSGAGGLGGIASVQTFTSSATWTKPTGVTKVMVEVQGAGGGGCRGGSYHHSGGGGGYAKKFLDVSSIGTSTITVGTGGAGAGNGVTGNGSAGGLSKWADGTNTVTGNGGAGASNSVNAYTAGGTGVGGDYNIPGQSGAANTPGGAAGDSVLGFGGLPPLSTDAPAGSKDGAGFGGGGSGWSGYSLACGSGSGGIVIVTEYK